MLLNCFPHEVVKMYYGCMYFFRAFCFPFAVIALPADSLSFSVQLSVVYLLVAKVTAANC